MAPKTPKKTISTSSSIISNSTPGGNNSSNIDNSILESRKRQIKRDEAIRRRVENDLSKKRYGKNSSNSNNRKRNKNYSPGSVLSLKPTEPVICKPNFTVYEAAQLMGARRENCILVVDDDEHLLGIFTAKDLAFRVVGKGLNAATLTIDQIMTSNPLCATTDTLASEALDLMVQRGFRHLPVLDEENSIVGVLDITKCYQEAMEKLERMYESSKKLHDALEGVNIEMGGNQQQPLQVLKYFESLKSVMNGPTLESVLDESSLPSYVTVKTSVQDAAILMKENHTTAVLVKDGNDDVSGIFTSKDVVLRVIAAGLDPKTVSVIRVMTSQPDVASKDLTIQAALRKMFEGHYLNLPVVEDNEIIGIVEVLKLTYATLNQISMMKSNDDDDDEENSSNTEGPAWNKFWKSLENDTESIHSDSQLNDSIIPDISQSEINQFSFNNLGHDDLAPNDSVSVTNDNFSSHIHQSTTNTSNTFQHHQQQQEEDIKNSPFQFKFKSPLNRNHRISIKPIEGIEKLRNLIVSKLNNNEFELIDKENFAISYLDDENDIVAITNDQDLIDCVLINKINSKLEKADLYIHHPDESIDLDEILANKKLQQQQQQHQHQHHHQHQSNSSNQIIQGISNEILLGSGVAILSAALIVAFTLGKKH
ncbi:hypothetical protein WICMUC_000248 [Wickerhamomyces mucosus]|uniref:CBS-domain-containing protein n=1 Tax=Wickerhamomyces mucosus TaxID=1378264 RepID=A0A9P8Q0G9_9ASCO|nr:hypothetical protein WICMUC_000248 [Wickerhamomyces mucosus]